MDPHPQTVRVAVIQAAPVYLDPDGCLDKARRLVSQAASKGAALVAFGEAWLPGYPVHALAGMDMPQWWDLASEYLDKAIDIPGPVTQALCDMAHEYCVDIVMGVAERDEITRGTIYCTQLIVSAEGELIGKHRKLRPAINERMVFGDGDGSGLIVHQRGFGTLGALIGCEHQMALPTYAMAEQGVQFHVASWPGGEAPAPKAPAALWPRQHLLSRAYALQTGSYVLCAAGILDPAQLPAQFRDYLREPMTGDSVIIDPRGEICAGPVTGETILYANCSYALIRAAKAAFDCAGHSGRPDTLEFRNHGLRPEDSEPRGNAGQSPDGGWQESGGAGGEEQAQWDNAPRHGGAPAPSR